MLVPLTVKTLDTSRFHPYTKKTRVVTQLTRHIFSIIWIRYYSLLKATSIKDAALITRSYHSFKRLQNFLPFHTKVLLSQSLTFSVLDYADVYYRTLYSEINFTECRFLFISIIFGMRKFD